MKIFFKLFVFCISVLLIFSLSSCNNSIEELVSSHISETRENFYYGQSDGYVATFTDGRREETYIMDGVKTNLVPYGVIVLWAEKNIGTNPKFVLSCGGQSFSGELEVNPYDGSYVADIECMIGREDSLILMLPSANISITLDNLSSSWQTTCSKALNIFTKAKKQALKTYVIRKDLKGEIYIKIVADKHDTKNICYYVLFVGQDGNTISTLIEVNSSQILQS